MMDFDNIRLVQAGDPIKVAGVGYRFDESSASYFKNLLGLARAGRDVGSIRISMCREDDGRRVDVPFADLIRTLPASRAD